MHWINASTSTLCSRAAVLGRARLSVRRRGNCTRERHASDDDARARADFDRIILPHLDAVTTYARWLTRDRDTADDIVQDTMLRAFRAFASFKGEDAKPWLLTIARNRFYSHMRRRNRGFRLRESDVIGDDGTADDLPGSDPESSLARRELLRTVEKRIASLPSEFREVLLLRELNDLSYREISERTSIPVGTVMSRLHRARAILRARLPPAEFP